MSKRINRIGQRYGSLVVIGAGQFKKGHLSWLCKCDCGNIVYIDAGHLADGHTKSCGHKEKQYYERLSDNILKCVLKDGRSFFIDADDYEKCSQCTWYIDNSGYVTTKINNAHVPLHKFLLGSQRIIDHINGDKTDNRRKNLRVVTHKQNCRNKGLSKNNTSGYKGVSFVKHNQKYHAQIMVDGKNHHLGYYVNPKEAAKAYDKAASFYFGEYARLNLGKGGNTIYGKKEVLELDRTSEKRRSSAKSSA